MFELIPNSEFSNEGTNSGKLPGFSPDVFKRVPPSFINAAVDVDKLLDKMKFDFQLCSSFKGKIEITDTIQLARSINPEISKWLPNLDFAKVDGIALGGIYRLICTQILLPLNRFAVITKLPTNEEYLATGTIIPNTWKHHSQFLGTDVSSAEVCFDKEIENLDFLTFDGIVLVDSARLKKDSARAFEIINTYNLSDCICLRRLKGLNPPFFENLEHYHEIAGMRRTIFQQAALAAFMKFSTEKNGSDRSNPNLLESINIILKADSMLGPSLTNNNLGRLAIIHYYAYVRGLIAEIQQDVETNPTQAYATFLDGCGFLMFDYRASLESDDSYSSLRSTVARLFISGIADLGPNSENSIVGYCEKDSSPAKSALALLKKLYAIDFVDEQQFLTRNPKIQ